MFTLLAHFNEVADFAVPIATLILGVLIGKLAERQQGQEQDKAEKIETK